jgi:predicted dehydrogenase
VSTVQIWPTAPERFRDCYDGPDCVWQFSDEQNDQAYKDEVQAFLNVCQGKPWPRELCTGVEAAHVVEIIQAAKQSAEHCEVVSLA